MLAYTLNGHVYKQKAVHSLIGGIELKNRVISHLIFFFQRCQNYTLRTESSANGVGETGYLLVEE